MTQTRERPPDTQRPPDPREPGQPTPRRGAIWRELPVLIVVAVLIAVAVRAFVLQTFWIPSGSMEHTLNIGDRVLVNKLEYDLHPPRRGEVIVFRSPVSWRSSPDEKDFIKRVIGVGGDHITCCDSKDRIRVNGHPLNESAYLYHDATGAMNPPSEAPFDITVPPDRLWVMGDHRSQSGDSREHYLQDQDIHHATIPVSSVIGRAFALYWQPKDDNYQDEFPLRLRWLGIPKTFDGVPDP